MPKPTSVVGLDYSHHTCTTPHLCGCYAVYYANVASYVILDRGIGLQSIVYFVKYYMIQSGSLVWLLPYAYSVQSTVNYTIHGSILSAKLELAIIVPKLGNQEVNHKVKLGINIFFLVLFSQFLTRRLMLELIY